ncbi:hypothetical protein [Kordiimonas sp.]|uniref:hypothetical protein n=1 Tax=Kordiimonas sp. TaxID=1970157 RepID=UPI003A91B6AD
MSKTDQTFPLLKYALIGDALASGATGLMMAAGASILSDMLGLSASLLTYAGLFLLPYAAAVAFVGTRKVINRRAVWPIVILNLLWVIDSVALLLTLEPAPTLFGVIFIVFQAVVVLAFAIAQTIGLKQQKNDAEFIAA